MCTYLYATLAFLKMPRCTLLIAFLKMPRCARGRPLTTDPSAWCRECLHTISACVQPAVLLQELEKGMADTHVPMRHCSGMQLSIGLFCSIIGLFCS
jgi:hypothetical protein